MDRAAFVSNFRAQFGVSEDTAERAADRAIGRAVEIPATDSRRLEKQIEHECDVMMQKLGFEVIRFSHPGKTRQTPGIPDRRYYHRNRIRLVGRDMTVAYFVVWVEFKSATGTQRPGQKLFQELVTDCGEDYVLGGVEELVKWLVDRGVAKRVGDQLEPADTGARRIPPRVGTALEPITEEG